MNGRKKRSREDKIFDFVVYTLLLVITLICLLPVWHIVVASFSNTTDIATAEGLLLWPKKFEFGAFEMVLKDPAIITGFKNTLLYLAGALPLNIILTVMAGYFLACPNMMWKKPIAGLITFTIPAPIRYAALAARIAAPAIFRFPATKSTFPKVPLFPFLSLAGKSFSGSSL